MCDLLDIPRSTYYKSLDTTISNREKEDIELTDKIIEINEASHIRYGAPEIHVLLKRAGYTFNKIVLYV